MYECVYMGRWTFCQVSCIPEPKREVRSEANWFCFHLSLTLQKVSLGFSCTWTLIHHTSKQLTANNCLSFVNLPGGLSDFELMLF